MEKHKIKTIVIHNIILLHFYNCDVHWCHTILLFWTKCSQTLILFGVAPTNVFYREKQKDEIAKLG